MRNELDWISGHKHQLRVSTLIGSGILVQRVRCVALVGTSGALNGDVVEEDFVGHGAREGVVDLSGLRCDGYCL